MWQTSWTPLSTHQPVRVIMDSLDPRLKGLDFSKIPITIPPPGVTPNFVNPQTIAPAIVAIGVVMAILTVSFVLLRLYSNHHAKRKFGIDDCMKPVPCNSYRYTRSWILTACRYMYQCNSPIIDGHRYRYQQ